MLTLSSNFFSDFEESLLKLNLFNLRLFLSLCGDDILPDGLSNDDFYALVSELSDGYKAVQSDLFSVFSSIRSDKQVEVSCSSR